MTFSQRDMEFLGQARFRSGSSRLQKMSPDQASFPPMNELGP